jgi:hypothetical protein
MQEETGALRDVKQEDVNDDGTGELEKGRDSPGPRAVDAEAAEVDPSCDHSSDVRTGAVSGAEVGTESRVGDLVKQCRRADFGDSSTGTNDPPRPDEH